MNVKSTTFLANLFCTARIVKLLVVFVALVAFSIIALPYLVARELYRRRVPH